MPAIRSSATKSSAATRRRKQYTHEQELFFNEHLPAYLKAFASGSRDEFLHEFFFPLWFDKFPVKASEGELEAAAAKTQEDIDDLEEWLRERKKIVRIYS